MPDNDGFLGAWIPHPLEVLPDRKDRVWLGESRPFNLPEIGRAFEPLHIFLWMDAHSEETRSAVVSPESRDFQSLMKSLVRGMMRPFSHRDPLRPARVAFHGRADLKRLQAALETMDIRVDSSAQRDPRLDRHFRRVEKSIRSGPGHSYLERRGVTPQQLGNFFESVVHFHDLCPWLVTGEEELFRIDGLEAKPLYVQVTGRRTEFGLSVCLTPEEVRTLLRSPSRPNPRTLRLVFDDYHHLGPRLLRDAIRHGLPFVDSETLPLAGRTGNTKDEALPAAADLDLLSDVIVLVFLCLKSREVDASANPLEFSLRRTGKQVSIEWPVPPPA